MVVAALISTPAVAQPEGWSTSWAASVQGPYPVGNPSAQPDQRFAFPTPQAGANGQTFRLVVRPDLWGRQARLRLSNAFGTRPVTFDGVVDFDVATLDPATGGIRPEFVPESTTGGPGDKLYPNRAGYLAMAMSVDPALVVPSLAGR